MQIEHDVPVPTDAKGERRYRFSDLGVGDSFWTPDPRLRVRSAAKQFARRKRPLNYRFNFRAENNGTRVWRVE